MISEDAKLWSDDLGTAARVVRYGHWGRPVLAFPAERGIASDFEDNGMVDAMAGRLDPSGWRAWGAQVAQHMPRFC